MKQSKSDNQSARVQPAAAAPTAAKTTGPAMYPDNRSVGVLQNKAQAPTGGEVLQRAGTKPNTASIDGKYRIKLSSVREKFVYEKNEELGLEGVLPGYHEVLGDPVLNGDGKVTQVKTKDGLTIDLKNPIDAPNSEKKLIVIDTVGYKAPNVQNGGGQENNAPLENLFMDVKIGTYTKSGEQFEMEGAGVFMQFFKKIEHNLKDWKRGSRKNGYDIDAKNLKDFEKAWENPVQKEIIKTSVAIILNKLHPILEKLEKAPIKFVGSSLFIVFNQASPNDSDVKLIDPDHPIILEEFEGDNIPEGIMHKGSFFERPEMEMMDGGGLLSEEHYTLPGRNYTEYTEKWKNSFDTGLINFVKWLRAHT